MAFPNQGQTASATGVSVMRKGSNWPRAGINGTNVQTKKAPMNAKALRPKDARATLLKGMR